MLTVFKLTLEVKDEQKVEMQKGSSILKIERQNKNICVWYLCDPEHELTEETFYVVRTGQQLPDTFPGAYINSVIFEPWESTDGIRDRNEKLSCFVCHVFFKRRPNVQRGKPIIAELNPNDDGAASTRAGGGS